MVVEMKWISVWMNVKNFAIKVIFAFLLHIVHIRYTRFVGLKIKRSKPMMNLKAIMESAPLTTTNAKPVDTNINDFV